MIGPRVALTLLRNRDLRRVMFGLAAHAIAEHSTWLAILVYSFDRGGISETGLVIFVLLMPAVVFAPLLSSANARKSRVRALTGGFAFQTLAMGFTAVAMLSGSHWLFTYSAAFVAAMSVLATRPLVNATLPTMARSLEELTAANAMSSILGTGGLFAGPALGGLVLSLSSPGGVYAFAGSMVAVAAIVMVSASIDNHDDEDDFDLGDPGDQADAVSRRADFTAGVRVLRDRREVRLIVEVLSLVFLASGAISVAYVAVAVDLLERSEASVGVLSAAFGFGALIGAIFSLSMVGLRRLTWPIAIGVVTVGLPMVAITFSDFFPLTVVLFAMSGFGRAIANVAGKTMLQGLAADDVLARIFGVLEGVSMSALALGALIFALFANRSGTEAALLVAGLALPALVITQLPRLMAIDRQRPMVDPSLVAHIRSIPAFAPLPAYSVEQLLVSLERAEFGPNEPIITIGEPGEHLFLVIEGDGTIIRSDGGNRPVIAGEYFGEIALLLDRPRTASIVAGDQGMVTLTIDRETFQRSLSGFPRSQQRIQSMANRRLASDNPPPA